MPTYYQSLRARLNRATEKQALERLEQSATRLYDAGQISVNELKRIDVAIMEKIAKLEN